MGFKKHIAICTNQDSFGHWNFYGGIFEKCMQHHCYRSLVILVHANGIYINFSENCMQAISCIYMGKSKNRTFWKKLHVILR